MRAPKAPTQSCSEGPSQSTELPPSVTRVPAVHRPYASRPSPVQSEQCTTKSCLVTPTQQRSGRRGAGDDLLGSGAGQHRAVGELMRKFVRPGRRDQQCECGNDYRNHPCGQERHRRAVECRHTAMHPTKLVSPIENKIVLGRTIFAHCLIRRIPNLRDIQD